MKKYHFVIILLFAFITTAFSQNSATLIKVDNKDVYLTTTIGHDITGTYLYDGTTEPIVLLNANGTGIYQFQDLSKNNISWGIESNEKGYPLFEKGFDSSKYSFWYKKTSDPEENWTTVQLSIHPNKKKIFIAGERSKDYIEKI
ncbi:hypothetical protein FFWV33_09970 [Flavobacterium faecale]|uniref:Uncharacterized protein n=1 Tax=Flavobacterium faecale TaxID=1355330 RepID=A0A2S1LDP5_9FLAO|nr:hypothetical protein [Flavobacterium faecale]AWG21837.1 hypothetical protein FFWV33_09970 [Flavobacterium faecale]